MKKILSLLVFVVMLAGCGPESEVEKPEEKGPLSTTINSDVFNFYPSDVQVHFTLSTPNTLVVIMRYAKGVGNANVYGIAFGFTDNKFTEASLTYVKENGKVYRTADFNPSETFTVKNYQFDENAKTVSFEYEGKLYESLGSNVNTSSKTISVKGKVDTKITNVNTGPFSPLPFVSFTAGNYMFSTVRSISARKDDGYTFYMNYLSHDGYRLQLTLDYPSLGFKFPVTYTFDVDDTVNNLTFMKFTGQPRATSPDVIRPEDWKTYPTKGTLTLNRILPDHYEGTFSIEVYDGPTLLHKTDNGKIVYTPNQHYPGW